MYKVNPSEGDIDREAYKVKVSQGRLNSVDKERLKVSKIDPMKTIGRFNYHKTVSFG